MTVFFTSDPHLGHQFVAGLRIAKSGSVIAGVHLDPHDPGWSTQEVKIHDDFLAQQWDATVGRDDQVWVLGDLCLGGRGQLENALKWISERPGDKHLVPGNHDKCHPIHRDSHKWLPMYLEVFGSVQLAARRKVTLPGGPVEVMLSHLPYFGDRDEEDRYTQWRLKNEGRWLFHGHLHADEPMHPERPRMIDVGVDAWGHKPVSLDTLTELISAPASWHRGN